jgi:CRP-like cAMP-binding protein
MENQELVNLPIFYRFTQKQIQQMKPFIEFCSFPADMVIFDQGDRADNFYILIAGEISMRFKPYDGPALVLSKIAPGGVFGWSAALNRDTYSSAAVSTSEISAIRFKATGLQNLCANDPVTGALFIDRLVSVISEKLHESHQDFLNMFSYRMNLNSDCKRRMKLNGSENRIYARRTDAWFDRTT